MKRNALPLLFLAGWIGLDAYLNGTGMQQQFSPDSFEHREARYIYVPLTDFILVENLSEPTRSKIVQFWLNEGYLAQREGEPRRWDVIYTVRGNRSFTTSGPAYSFWNRACGSDETADAWIAWSQRHPELAAKVWPDVVHLLSRGDDDEYRHARILAQFATSTSVRAEFDRGYELWQSWYGP